MSREEELKLIIKNAEAELEVLTKTLTWTEACKYLYDNRHHKLSVQSVNHIGFFTPMKV